jgi:hypothetical protein
LRKVKDLTQRMNCRVSIDFSAGRFAREFVMSLATMTVHVELAEPRDDRIRLAGDLALRFQSAP